MRSSHKHSERDRRRAILSLAEQTEHSVLSRSCGSPGPGSALAGMQWAGSTLQSVCSAKVRSNLCPTGPKCKRRAAAQSQPRSLLHSPRCRPGHRKGHVNPRLGDDLLLRYCSYGPCLRNQRKHFMLPKYYIVRGGGYYRIREELASVRFPVAGLSNTLRKDVSWEE